VECVDSIWGRVSARAGGQQQEAQGEAGHGRTCRQAWQISPAPAPRLLAFTQI
jgi:hypothetical protein